MFFFYFYWKNRNDTVRTCDILIPNQAFYHLNYIPETGIVGIEPTIAESKSAALPLGYTPIYFNLRTHTSCVWHKDGQDRRDNISICAHIQVVSANINKKCITKPTWIVQLVYVYSSKSNKFSITKQSIAKQTFSHGYFSAKNQQFYERFTFAQGGFEHATFIC